MYQNNKKQQYKIIAIDQKTRKKYSKEQIEELLNSLCGSFFKISLQTNDSVSNCFNNKL